MFCGNCGNQMAESDKFCNKCGFRNTLAVSAPTVQTSSAGAPAPKKAPGKKFPVGILVAILASVVVLGIAVVMLLSSDSVQNWMKKNFSEPEEYYQWVEEKAVQEAASNMAIIYDDYIKESLSAYDMSVRTQATLELEEAGMDMLSLAGMAGVDLSWLESMTLTGEVSLKDNVLAFSVAEPDILSAAGILDFADERIYLQFPDLSKTYLASDVYDTDELVEYLEVLKILYENTPDEKLVENLFEKYSQLALQCLNDVDMSETTIRAEGVQQDCVELEVTIDENDMAKMAETVLTALSEDEDVKKWMLDSLTALEDADLDIGLDMDPEEFYEAFTEELEYALDEVDSITDYETEIVMCVYVDSKGNVCGRRYEYEDATVETLMVHDGADFGYSYVYEMESYGEELALVGSGKDDSGRLSGEFSFEYNGMAIMDITVDELDTNKLKKGQLSSTFTVAPSTALVRMMDMTDYSSIIDELAATVDVKGNANSLELVCAVYQGEEKWGALTFTAEKSKGEKAKIPSSKQVIDAEDDEDLLDWLATVDWDAYIAKLEKTSLPSEIIAVIEEIADMDGDELLRMLYYVY